MISLTIKGRWLDHYQRYEMLTSRSIYVELADEYKILDAVSDVPKRKLVAHHLRDVIDVLEQKVCSYQHVDLDLSLVTFCRGTRSHHCIIY